MPQAFTRDEKRKAVEREIALRRNVYRKKVAARTMRQADAEREIAVMEAIREDYVEPAAMRAGGSLAAG